MGSREVHWNGENVPKVSPADSNVLGDEAGKDLRLEASRKFAGFGILIRRGLKALPERLRVSHLMQASSPEVHTMRSL